MLKTDAGNGREVERKATDAELALLSEVKSAADALKELVGRVDVHLTEQYDHAHAAKDLETMERLHNADPLKWLGSAKHTLQTGLMCLRRAIEQPDDF